MKNETTDATSRALQIVRRYVPDAMAVRDAEREVYVEVHRRDVKGAHKTPDDCPLARASCSEMELDGALVSRGIVYLVRNGVAERYQPAHLTREALNHFDETGEFQPGIYKFVPPGPAQSLGAQNGRRARGTRGGTRRPRQWLKGGGLRARLNG